MKGRRQINRLILDLIHLWAAFQSIDTIKKNHFLSFSPFQQVKKTAATTTTAAATTTPAAAATTTATTTKGTAATTTTAAATTKKVDSCDQEKNYNHRASFSFLRSADAMGVLSTQDCSLIASRKDFFSLQLGLVDHGFGLRCRLLYN